MPPLPAAWAESFSGMSAIIASAAIRSAAIEPASCSAVLGVPIHLFCKAKYRFLRSFVFLRWECRSSWLGPNFFAGGASSSAFRYISRPSTRLPCYLGLQLVDAGSLFSSSTQDSEYNYGWQTRPLARISRYSLFLAVGVTMYVKGGLSTPSRRKDTSMSSGILRRQRSAIAGSVAAGTKTSGIIDAPILRGLGTRASTNRPCGHSFPRHPGLLTAPGWNTRPERSASGTTRPAVFSTRPWGEPRGHGSRNHPNKANDHDAYFSQ